MENLPVLCVVTSKLCGHCIAMRGDKNSEPYIRGNLRGEIEPGPAPEDPHLGEDQDDPDDKLGPLNYWTYHYFKRLMLKPGTSIQRLRIFEINYNNFSSRPDFLEQLNEFVWNPETHQIDRHSYTQAPMAVNSPLPDAMIFERINTERMSHPLRTSFSSFVEFFHSKIPKQVGDLVQVFPQWMCFTGESWNRCLEERNSTAKTCRLVGLVDGYNLVERDGLLALDRDKPFKPKHPIGFTRMFFSRLGRNDLPSSRYLKPSERTKSEPQLMDFGFTLLRP